MKVTNKENKNVCIGRGNYSLKRNCDVSCRNWHYIDEMDQN